MKKIIIAGLLAGALFIGGTGVHAAEIQKDGQTYYEVEAGDTLSAIGNKYGLDHSLIHQSNLDTVSDANMIFVGDLLLIPTNGEVQAPATAAVVEAPVVQENVVEQAPVVEQSPVVEQAPSAGTNSAKEWIAQRESGGSYSATNGRYIGRYQLDSAYLNGDHSPANQERVAENYVAQRYGSWEAAQAFWMANGWY
ncbi:aggregation promoting factor [Efunavirus H1]|uniref:Aggregation promoting factor n=1 Tax=Enterococcus phage H1 TaxID=2982918 RepID=A0A9Y1DIV9_9CAUD|nr:aggregation promoting factor [Enterococcus phage H1]